MAVDQSGVRDLNPNLRKPTLAGEGARATWPI
ncbi:MAG: hypothetical protein JWO71_4810 [Candidatus Acidoferrum typicum]|nr:hypothetical protein [Candidatus Acidoferrum typicum]